MDKKKLIDIIRESHFPSDSYSINEVNDESLCIVEEYGRWVIFYSEKDLRSDPKYFDNENKACDEFLRELRKMINHL